MPVDWGVRVAVQNLRRNDAYDGAPTEPDSADAHRVIESVCAAFHFGKDLGVGWGDLGVDAALDLLCLAIAFGLTAQVCGRHCLEIGILCNVRINFALVRCDVALTYLPNLLAVDSFNTRLLTNFAATAAMM